MAGSVQGGKAAAATNKARHGDDFYKKIGGKGGRNGTTGGFASDKVGSDGLTGHERASKVGSKGGANSHRTWTDEERAAAAKRMRKSPPQGWRGVKRPQPEIVEEAKSPTFWERAFKKS